MKKSILFLIVILLSACASTPQVTVTPTPPPTETPIPTPTVTPQFAALQEKIASSGSRFSLNEDGLVYDGAEPIPGLRVAPDGTMTLTVNGEQVVIDSAKAVFDDEKGFFYPGYTQNPDGSWVMALPDYLKLNKDGSYNLTLSTGETVKLEATEVSLSGGNVAVAVLAEGYYMTPDGWRMTPEKMWSNEASEWGVNLDKYTERQDIDGNLAIVDESGTVVYWVDAEGVGYWNLQTMRKMIVETTIEEKACYPTGWIGTKGQSVPPKVDAEAYDRNFAKPFSENFKQKILELGIMKDYPLGFKDFLGGENNCWASTRIKKVGQVPDDLEINYIFWLNLDKVLQYEQVFSPRVKKIELVK